MEGASLDEIRTLFDHYLAHGCPCRFPRFRATVARDMRDFGAGSWNVSDINQLLTSFDERLPLVEVEQKDCSALGRCSICGARVLRSWAPVFRDSFLERAQITPGELPDLGAEVMGIVPVCGSIYPAAPVNATKAERSRLRDAYPRLAPKDWHAYMSALAGPGITPDAGNAGA